MNDNDWQNNTTYQWQDYPSQSNDTASAWQSSSSESYTKSYTGDDYWDDKRRREILYPSNDNLMASSHDNYMSKNNQFLPNNYLNEKLSLKARKIIVYGGGIFLTCFVLFSFISEFIFKYFRG